MRHEQTNPYAPFFMDCASQHVLDFASAHNVQPSQLCKRFSSEDEGIHYSYFDQRSVMFYSMPEELVGPQVANIYNTKLSPMDAFMISLLYPRYSASVWDQM